MPAMDRDDIRQLAEEINTEYYRVAGLECLGATMPEVAEAVLRKRLVPLGHSLPFEGELHVGGRKEGA
jgi:hypothetical protein